MRFLVQESWSPYVVGIGIGVLSWFAFATANKPIGITTAFEYTAGLPAKAATPELAQPYLQVMLTAVAVGAIGVWIMVAMGWASLSIKPAAFGGVIVGAILFGTGMAIFGYCPGTSIAACGEGRRDAMVGVVGMLAGALVYVATFPALQGLVNALGNLGEVTLPAVTGLSPWIFVGTLAIAAFLVAALVQRRAEQH